MSVTREIVAFVICGIFLSMLLLAWTEVKDKYNFELMLQFLILATAIILMTTSAVEFWP